MKRLLAVIATSFFAVGVSANDVYGSFGQGNSDVSDQHPPHDHMVAAQPSVGDSFDRYQGLAYGNPDLFKAVRLGPNGDTSDPDIYHGVGGNSDLQF